MPLDTLKSPIRPERPPAGAGRWRVLLTDDRKSLFQLVADPRIRIQEVFDPEQPPDLIVLPCTKLDGSFAESAKALPPQAWRGVGVVFDASGKGPQPTGKFVRRLHRFLEERGIAEDRCAFVSNNRRTRLRGSNIRVVHYDYWLRKLFRGVREQGLSEFEFRYARFRAREQTRARRFLSFNLTARPWKLVFLLGLLRDGLWDSGFVSFGGFDHLAKARGGSVDSVRRDLLETEGAKDLAAELVDFLPALEAKGQVLFGPVAQTSGGAVRKLTDGMPVAEYDRSWFSVTTETDMLSDADCVTEKSFKSLLNFHPQVVMGNPGAVARLRAFGFQSFAEVIDEAYDEEENPRRRFEMAYAEVRRLCAADEAEMARAESEMSEALTANARWGLGHVLINRIPKRAER